MPNLTPLAEECLTAARVVRELATAAGPSHADMFFSAGRQNGKSTRTAWLDLMSPAFGIHLAELLSVTAVDIERLSKGVSTDTIELIYTPHLRVARHLIQYAPAVPR